MPDNQNRPAPGTLIQRCRTGRWEDATVQDEVGTSGNFLTKAANGDLWWCSPRYFNAPDGEGSGLQWRLPATASTSDTTSNTPRPVRPELGAMVEVSRADGRGGYRWSAVQVTRLSDHNPKAFFVTGDGLEDDERSAENVESMWGWRWIGDPPTSGTKVDENGRPLIGETVEVPASTISVPGAKPDDWVKARVVHHGEGAHIFYVTNEYTSGDSRYVSNMDDASSVYGWRKIAAGTSRAPRFYRSVRYRQGKTVGGTPVVHLCPQSSVTPDATSEFAVILTAEQLRAMLLTIEPPSEGTPWTNL